MPHECTNCGREFADGSKEMLSGCPDCGGNKFQFVPAIETGPAADASPSSEDDRGETTAANRRSSATDERTRAWPSTDDSTDDPTDDRSIGEFEEWPDSARRPEDRSAANRSGSDADPSTSDAGSAVDADRSTSGVDRSSDPFDYASSEPQRETPTDGETTDERVGSDAATESENEAQADARSEVVSPEELPDPPEHASGPNDPEYGRVVSEPDEERPSLEQLREELNEQFESIKIVRPGQYELNLMELYDREEYIVSLQEDGRYVIEVPESWRADEE